MYCVWNFTALLVMLKSGGLVLGVWEDATLSIRSTKTYFSCTCTILVILLYRLIHAFTCAGILPSQYIHFSQFATIGVVGKWYITSSKLHTHIYIHTYIHVHTYIHTYIHTRIYIHTYIHTYIRICTYIHNI